MLNNIGNVAYERGYYAEARTALAEAVRIGEQLGMAATRTLWQANLGVNQRMLGDRQGALDTFAAVIEAAGDGRYSIAEIIARLNRAAMLLQSDPAVALDDIEQGHALARSANIHELQAYADYLRAWLAFYRDDPATIELCGAAQVELVQVRLYGYVASMATAQAAAYARQGDLVAATAALAPLLNYLAAHDFVQLDEPMRCITLAVPVLRAAGHYDSAGDLLRSAAQWLAERAVAFDDERERRRFLHEVPEHAAVLALTENRAIH
jgi:tetratricopeptide (TPR) repeat protein